MWQTPSICLSPAWLSVFNYFSEAIWAQIRIMNAQHPPSSELEVAAIPIGLRIVAMFLRTLFLGALVAITVRISSPQSETIWTVYETPGDLIRLALGFAVCLWIVLHLFRLPKNPEIYKNWVYLGFYVVSLQDALAS